MAVFSVDIDDNDIDRVVGAICANYGYQAQLPNSEFDPLQPVDPETNPETIANTETPRQFANRKTRDFLMENTVAYELRVERENVQQPAPPAITDPN